MEAMSLEERFLESQKFVYDANGYKRVVGKQLDVSKLSPEDKRDLKGIKRKYRPMYASKQHNGRVNTKNELQRKKGVSKRKQWNLAGKQKHSIQHKICDYV